MNKKNYLHPDCTVLTMNATPILAGSPPKVSAKSNDPDGPNLDYGGSTDDEENQGTVFIPW